VTEQDPALATVVALERRLLHAPTRGRRRELERLLHAERRDIGASGRTWDRESTIAALAAEASEWVSIRDVVARFVADDVVLVTYAAVRVTSRERDSMCSSLWLNGEDGWQVIFHQGTPVESAP
jgi:hypothetical protein